jgi:hypothetical protein
MDQPLIQSRVNYFRNQYLRRQDFSDEQAYQIALQRRHNIGQHSWGIVVGLELAFENGALVVRPGLAIDGYGRELLLPVKKPIDSVEFLRLGSNRLDVWLFYENTLGAGAPSGYVACGETAGNYYRSNETPRIFLERAAVSRVTARRPKSVPATILEAPTQLQTNDDPLAVWPVYLGRLTYQPEEPDLAKQVLVDASDRTYVGVTAEVIDHPASACRIEIGKASQSDEQRQVGDTTYTYKNTTHKRAFAVFVPPDDPGEVELAPRFEIDLDGNNYLRGKDTIYGNLQMAKGGAVQFTEPAKVDETVARDKPSVYRASDTGFDELRIDLGTQDDRTLVIGFTAEDGSFQTSIKLEYSQPSGASSPQPLVTIYGDLKMNGLLDSPNVLERSLTAETLNALLASFQAGSIAAGGQ